MFSKYLYINNKAITCIQTCVSMLMCLNSVVSHELAWIAQDDLRVDIVCVFFHFQPRYVSRLTSHGTTS